MDICHLKNAELEAKHQKYKGRVVLRGDIVKYDSGSYAVFTEQGSSASQMTAAKVMDIISRLPGCDGQAADAVSAKTQVEMEDAHKLHSHRKHVCAWCRYTRGRFERTHGDVLSGHTGVSACHTLTHTHQHTQHNTTQHITTTTPHDNRKRQRERQTERETETERDRQGQRQRQREQRREKIHFQCGGAWPFFFFL